MTLRLRARRGASCSASAPTCCSTATSSASCSASSLISQAAVLTLIASGLTRGSAPIYPLPGGPVSDPLSQAMALTAIVIGLAVTALLLALVLRVVVAYRVRELDEVAEEEAERDERLEREDAGEHARRGGGGAMTAALDRAGRPLGGRHRARAPRRPPPRWSAGSRSPRWPRTSRRSSCSPPTCCRDGPVERRRPATGRPASASRCAPTRSGVLFAALSSLARARGDGARGARRRARARVPRPRRCCSPPA